MKKESGQTKKAILGFIQKTIDDPSFFKKSKEQQVAEAKSYLRDEGVFEKELNKTQKRE